VGLMADISEEALLLAIKTRDDLFDSLQEMVDNKNYFRVLMKYDDDLTQGEIADEAGVNQSTVSRAVNSLQDAGLLEETDEGYEKELTVIDHPIMQYFFEEEVIRNG